MPAPLLPEEHVTVEMDMDSKHTARPTLDELLAEVRDAEYALAAIAEFEGIELLPACNPDEDLCGERICDESGCISGRVKRLREVIKKAEAR